MASGTFLKSAVLCTLSLPSAGTCPYTDNPFSGLGGRRARVEDAKPVFVFDRQSELAFLKAADTWSFGIHFLLAKLAQVRYLPPYSPDLNPVELAFSKFKKLLRDGAERTTEKLWNLCGNVLHLFTESECRNYLRHCGYRYS